MSVPHATNEAIHDDKASHAWSFLELTASTTAVMLSVTYSVVNAASSCEVDHAFALFKNKYCG